MRQQVDAAHSREAAARNVQERLGGASGKCGRLLEEFVRPVMEERMAGCTLSTLQCIRYQHVISGIGISMASESKYSTHVLDCFGLFRHRTWQSCKLASIGIGMPWEKRGGCLRYPAVSELDGLNLGRVRQKGQTDFDGFDLCSSSSFY